MKNNGRGVTSERVRETVIFAMLGSLMFCSKILTEVLPNIHLLGLLTMVYTLTYRLKALIPIYVFVLLTGVYAGFSLWWLPYLYIWTLLWGMTMLLPRRMPKKVAYFVYPAVCCIHGLAYGILYSPAQALMFGLNFEQTLTWIAAGFPFDLIHGISNFIVGFCIPALSELLGKLSSKRYR